MSSADPKWLLLAAGAFIGLGVWWSLSSGRYAPPDPGPGAPIPVRAQYSGGAIARAFTEGPIELHGKSGKMLVERAPDLVLSTGRLVVAEECKGDAALERALPPGTYPVKLAVFATETERKTAFARIEVAAGAPVKWKASGDAAIVPAATVAAGSAAFCDLELAMQRMGGNPLVLDEKSGANLVGLSSGTGNFPVYYGFDARGKVLAVVADFGVVTASVATSSVSR